MPYLNPYSWNKNASVFYIEQPAGVGYSICPNKSECVFNDTNSATDNLLGLQSWFAKFTDYKTHDFYITGESYGGIYIPWLAKRVLDFNKNNPDDAINLKGMAIGNGCTDWRFDTVPGFLEMSFYHGLVGWALKDDFDRNSCIPDYEKPECKPYVDKFNELTEDRNPYDIYNLHERDFPMTNPDYAKFLHPNFKRSLYKKQGLLKATINDGTGMTRYINTDEFRAAFHIDASAPAWADCADIVYDIDMATGSIGLYSTDFKDAGLKILHYSGDTDGVVPTLGTLNWITNANYVVTDEWKPWYTADQQVAGYFQGYEGLNFTTIHGTGHMVPQWKRPQAHQMIMNFLNGNNFNTTYAMMEETPRFDA